VASRCFTGYIYSSRLAVIAIYHFFTFRFGFSSSLPHLTTMEDKRGTKRSRSPLKEGSSSPSSASMLPPSPSRSLSPPGSPPEVSSCCLRSPVFEQGGPSERIYLRTRKISSLTPRRMKNSLGSSSATLTAVFLGRPMMATSSSSATPMKKRRCARRTPPRSMLRHILP
jgi:hypothetical protein